MTLPDTLQAALEARLAGVPQAELVAAAEKISLRYRERQSAGQYIQTPAEALAYAVARMPATYAAVFQALGYSLACLKEPLAEPVSLADFGAGTGAAAWAASELLPLHSVLCLEYAGVMRQLGEAFMRGQRRRFPSVLWRQWDMTRDEITFQPDVIIASYAVNELRQDQQLETAEKLWQAAGKLLLFVEPGTPEGFGVIMRIRKRLLEKGAHILAPCPQAQECPLLQGDWCHFTCRVQRSRLHKLAKGGVSPFEDEKYTYLAVSKKEDFPCQARVLRHPYIGKGYVKLNLCTQQGLVQQTFTKKDGLQYKAAKKAGCGDAIFRKEHQPPESQADENSLQKNEL